MSRNDIMINPPIMLPMLPTSMGGSDLVASLFNIVEMLEKTGDVIAARIP
jgi:hypothetical protein